MLSERDPSKMGLFIICRAWSIAGWYCRSPASFLITWEVDGTNKYLCDEQVGQRSELTEPMERKKPKVAALLSMY